MKTRITVAAAMLAFCLAKSAYAQNKYYLPQVADGHYAGGSYRTTFILFNNTNGDTAASLELTDNEGNPLVVTIPSLGASSQFSIPLAAGGSRVFQTASSGSLVVGAATVTSSVRIGVSAIFTVYGPGGNYLTEAGVGTSDLMTEFVLPVDTTGVFNTGLALHNIGVVDASITLILRGTNGVEVLRTMQPLNARKHLARFVAGPDQFFPSLGSFQGTLLVQSSAPIAALVLRQHLEPLSFTSLPVAPSSSARTTLSLAHWANGVFSTGSYKNSFLIFNISSTAANVVLSLTAPVAISGLGTGTSFNLAPLAPGASIFLQTDGLGALAKGAATITSNVPIGASGIFTLSDTSGAFTTEAGVGDSPGYTSLTLPVYRIGGFDTGVAFYKSGGSSTTLTFRLLDPDGYQVGSSATRNLGGNGQMAEFVSEIFPGATNFWGSIAITATVGVSAMTLRENKAPLSYTTLPIVSGVSNGKAPVGPLLSKTVTDVTALSNNPNVDMSQTLTSGFRLSGTVSGAGIGVQVVASAGGNDVFAGAVDPLTGKYLIVVPAGIYSLKACYQPAGAAAAVVVTFVDPAVVPVAGDATRDLILPPATLLPVSGMVSGLSGLPAGTITTITFISNDQTTQGRFTVDAGGNYQGVMPAGTYVVSVGRQPIQFLLLQSESLQLYNLGSVTIPGGSGQLNFAIPATAILSGTISSGNVTIPPGTAVTATDTSAPQITQIVCCDIPSTSATSNLLGQYQMVLAQGRSFAVSATVQFWPGVNLLSMIRYPETPGSTNLSASTTLDLPIPRIPASANIFGPVTDSLGNPVANVVVIAYSKSIQNAAGMGFTAMGKTDIYGNYSIIVLSGTSYQVTFVPPAPGR
jgi:hypothetical protein